MNYSNQETGAPQSVSVLYNINRALEDQVSRYYNVVNSLQSKVDNISNFPKTNEAASNPQETKTPNDHTSALQFQLDRFILLNNQLEYIAEHVHTIGG